MKEQPKHPLASAASAIFSASLLINAGKQCIAEMFLTNLHLEAARLSDQGLQIRGKRNNIPMRTC